MQTNRLKVLACALSLGALGGVAHAADHRDGPGVDKDATVDITDVYAWTSSDGKNVNLVMDLQGANTGATTTTKFSNAALYVFHITSGTKFGEKAKSDTIICQFDGQATQGYQCWAPSGEYVAGKVGDKAGAKSASGKIQAAALVRDDPFWFNIRGFIAVAGTVKSVAGSLKFDAAGCPAIDKNTSSLLVSTLASDGANGKAADDFGKGGKSPVACAAGTCSTADTTNGNVLSIVLSVDKTLLTSGGSMLSVWGSTNMVGQ